MKTLFPALTLLLISTALFAQDFEVPKDFDPKKEKDYAKYEKEVIKCVNWLMATPVNKQAAKRKEANGFLLKWVSGAPNVSIEIRESIVTFSSNAELLMTFMGGWTKYVLETKDTDKHQGALKGLESVVAFYEKNKEAIGADENVEKYVEMKKNGTLEEYVKANS